ncbi:MAG: ABC-2 family transporter protein [Dehalococcoidales bacterium]|nr:ABC-2 family transporter protein [Dehalococcoidales bacterium]
MADVLNSLSLYFKLVAISIRSQMQYKASFLLMSFGNFLITFIEFIGVLVLFTRFGTLQGWELEEVAMFYGFINIGFALSQAFGRGFDQFQLQVIHGEFDRTLLRPRSTAYQVLAHDFELLRVGRLLQGVAIFIWGVANAAIAWNAAKVILLLVAVLGNVGVFTGLYVMQAAMCFWSTQSLEVMNSFTDGGVQSIQWPLPIFKRWFAMIFIFIIPLACVNYFPLVAILGKVDPMHFPVWFQWTAPLVGLLFFRLSLLVWEFGVRHYHSTGS